jgi:alanyl-tRNA synthetase
LNKTVYLLSVEESSGKVAHVNWVSPELKAKGVDAQVWASKVTDIVGGKVFVNMPPV